MISRVFQYLRAKSYLLIQKVFPIAAGTIKTYGIASGCFALSDFLYVRLKAKKTRRNYKVVTKEQICNYFSGDVAFIFGSGPSLLRMSEREWGLIAEYTTIGVNYIVDLHKVPISIHYVREIGLEMPDRYNPRVMRSNIEYYGFAVDNNPFYDKTILLIQDEYRGWASNMLTGLGYLRPGRSIFLYKAAPYDGFETRPALSFEEGLPRRVGAIGGAVSAAVSLGFKEIVLTGVDMVNKTHFYAEPAPNDDPNVVHSGYRRGYHLTLAAWARTLEAMGVKLYVYNPRSSLADKIPAWRWDDGTDCCSLGFEDS